MNETRYNAEKLRVLNQTMFDFLLRLQQCSTLGDKQFEAMFEYAVHQDHFGLLLKRLNEVDTQDFI
ncbi:hypothetical protein [Paenibacillus lautus]|uniref:hypothetical protein n=1 Tax=Paenibacillus lautus TaxID=1401 RepID=UPI001C7CF2ED|nr:hypothetical protein [Paenibacillus lautus]